MKNIVIDYIEYKYGKTEYYGTYGEGVRQKDIIEKFGNGMYHELRYFNEGTFIFIKHEKTDEEMSI